MNNRAPSEENMPGPAESWPDQEVNKGGSYIQPLIHKWNDEMYNNHKYKAQEIRRYYMENINAFAHDFFRRDPFNTNDQ